MGVSLPAFGTCQHCIISKSLAGDTCFNSCLLHCCIPKCSSLGKGNTCVCDGVNLTLHRRLGIQSRQGAPKCLYPALALVASLVVENFHLQAGPMCELCTAGSLIAAGSLCFKIMCFERAGLAHIPMLDLCCFILKRLGDI